MSTGDWKIHRRDARCARCERSFTEGDPVWSLLFLGDGGGAEGPGLRREDRCAACFRDPAEAPAPAPAPEGTPRELLFWRTRHSVDRRARFAVDFEALEELFLGLEGRREERLQELRYLLALLLLRKKRLRLVGVRRHVPGLGGGPAETLCVRRPRRVEEHEVPVFELDTERALVLKAELARVFEGADVESLARAGVADADPPGDPGAPGGTRVGDGAASVPGAEG